MTPPPTASTSTAETVQGKHVFEVIGYSKHRGLGHDAMSFVRSTTFSVGGHSWSIRLYPDGYLEQNQDYITVYLELMSRGTTLRASCDLRLVDRSTGLSFSVHRTEPRIFNTVDVIKGHQTSERKPDPRIQLPPSDILEHLGKLLEEGEGSADVTFSVGGQTFAVHRTILAMRSPVFKAELFGPMREGRTQSVTIQGMQPAVFKALLHFIYTDSLPSFDDLESDDRSEMTRHLLEAADRYGMDRLKMMCQSILCEDLNVKNVATTLALADQHSCNILMDACVEFISSSTIGDVVETKGFVDVKRSKPSVLVDAFVKMIQFFTKR
ncbi:hypothetical protein ACP70R_003120 [Stipagrostis hirtigluma subsp. patula]